MCHMWNECISRTRRIIWNILLPYESHVRANCVDIPRSQHFLPPESCVWIKIRNPCSSGLHPFLMLMQGDGLRSSFHVENEKQKNDLHYNWMDFDMCICPQSAHSGRKVTWKNIAKVVRWEETYATTFTNESNSGQELQLARYKHRIHNGIGSSKRS